LCMIMNLSIGAQEQEPSEWSLFESAPEKHLLPSVKHWDYLLIVENSDFAFDLESVLKKNEKNHNRAIFRSAHTTNTTRNSLTI